MMSRLPHLAPEEIQAAVSAPPERTLRHLLSCAACRASARALTTDVPHDSEVPTSSEGQEAFRRKVLAIHEDMAQAPARLEELLARPDPLEAAKADPSFCSPGLIRLLLTTCTEEATPPDRQEELAFLAFAILHRLDPQDVPEDLIREWRVEARCILGDVSRIRGNFQTADAILLPAAEGLGAPLDCRERGLILERLAALRRDQGRLDEALALYQRAGTLFETFGHADELARVRLDEGCLRLTEGDPDTARFLLEEAACLFDPSKQPAQAASAHLSLALAALELGDQETARHEAQLVHTLLPAMPAQSRELSSLMALFDRSFDTSPSVGEGRER